jgi:hypothetical protein
MSSWEKELRDKAKAQAEKVIRRAARDGKITKKDFRDVAERTFPLSGSALNNTYMANEIARALKKDPTLRIGKKSAEVTGVRLNKRGQLTHEFPEDRTANFNGNSSPVTFPGRGGYDKGSANWVQNSRGSYTYIGDIPSRTKKEEDAPETPAGTDDPPRDPFAGLTGGESGNDTSSAGGNSSSGGSGRSRPWRITGMPPQTTISIASCPTFTTVPTSRRARLVRQELSIWIALLAKSLSWVTPRTCLSGIKKGLPDPEDQQLLSDRACAA